MRWDRDRRKSSGGRWKCTVKHSARMRAYYEAHREEILARQRAYREAHREELAARSRAYSEAHREEKAARNRAYYEAHREELAARVRAYYHERGWATRRKRDLGKQRAVIQGQLDQLHEEATRLGLGA